MSNYEDLIGPQPSGVVPEQDYAAVAAATRDHLGLDNHVETRVEFDGVVSQPEVFVIKNGVDADSDNNKDGSEYVGDDDSSDGVNNNDPPELQIRDDSASNSSDDEPDKKQNMPRNYSEGVTGSASYQGPC